MPVPSDTKNTVRVALASRGGGERLMGDIRLFC
jgi:hypothetical protein